MTESERKNLALAREELCHIYDDRENSWEQLIANIEKALVYLNAVAAEDEKSSKKTLKNTKISYLYRDGSNYKVRNEAVLAGAISKEQITAVAKCLNMGEYFIPYDVGLPETRFEKWTEDDHCWFELSKDSFSPTDEPATVDVTVQELVDNFLKMEENWDDAAALNRLKEEYKW